jgi:hypothetical protein
MVDSLARRRSKYQFTCQDSQLSQDRYSVSDESADFGSQGFTPLVQYTSQSLELRIVWNCGKLRFHSNLFFRAGFEVVNGSDLRSIWLFVRK